MKMKKLLFILMMGTLLCGLTACGDHPEAANAGSSQPSVSERSAEPSEDSQQLEEQEESRVTESEPILLETEESGNNALIVYFSATGNTRSVAETLADMQGADLYEIVPEQPYTAEDLNYNDRTTRATVEQNDATARPAISGGVDRIEDYQVLYVGFPIWWGDMPRICYTFFDTYDLSGKTIAPFCTSGGSGISRARQSIEELEPSATVTEGLQTNTSNAANDLSAWLNRIGLAE